MARLGAAFVWTVLFAVALPAVHLPARALAQDSDTADDEAAPADDGPGEEAADPEPAKAKKKPKLDLGGAEAADEELPDAGTRGATGEGAGAGFGGALGGDPKKDAPAAPNTKGGDPKKDGAPQPGSAAKKPGGDAASAVTTGRVIELPTEAQLKEHLEARARYLRAGDPSNAEVELGLMLDAQHALGVLNVVVASAALMHEANTAKAEGHLEQAIKLAETAARVSPDLSSAHWMRARLYFEQDWSQGARIVSALGDLLHAKLDRFRNTIALIANLIAGLSLALLAWIALFTVIQVVKYVRYPAHDVTRWLPAWFGEGQGVMVLSIAMVSPLVLGLGAPVALVLALFTVYAYQSIRERIVSVIAVVLLAAAPVVIYLLAPFVTYHGSIADAMETVMSEAFTEEAETQLADFARSYGRGDIDVALLLAHRYRMRGDLAAAELEYKRALAAQPSNASARNNLGVLLYFLGREEAALGTFQAASNSAQRAEPILNLASILLDQSNFDEAKAMIDRARKIDPGLTARYTARESGRTTAEKLLWAEMDQGVLWSRLLEVDAPRREAVMTALWRRVGGITPPWWMTGIALFTALTMVMFGRRADKLRLSAGCPKCGVPADREAPAGYCDQCQSIFLKAIAVEPMLRIAKEEDVRSYQRRKRWTERLLSLVAGAGQIFAGSPIAGSITFLLLSFALASMAFSDGFIVHPWSVGFDPSAVTFQLGVGGAVALFLSLLSLRSAFK